MIERSEIITEVEKELDFLLREAPESVAVSARKQIRGEAVDEVRRILDSLSKQELQSESALQRFIETTVASARMRMHQK
jgi:biopolymer transport protein ExbB/TolQ